jgi:hypothetical protein
MAEHRGACAVFAVTRADNENLQAGLNIPISEFNETGISPCISPRTARGSKNEFFLRASHLDVLHLLGGVRDTREKSMHQVAFRLIAELEGRGFISRTVSHC